MFEIRCQLPDLFTYKELELCMVRLNTDVKISFIFCFFICVATSIRFIILYNNSHVFFSYVEVITSANNIDVEALGYKDNITLTCDLPNPQFYLVPPVKQQEEKEKSAEGGETKQEPTEVLIETKEGKYKLTDKTLIIEDISKIFYFFFILIVIKNKMLF